MSISVIVPARNEEKNINDVIVDLKSIPMVEEIIIVEGNSTDNTWKVAQLAEESGPGFIRAIKQDGKNKFNAVLCGIKVAKSEHVMIWDADNTVSIPNQIEMMKLAGKEPGFLWTGNRLRGSRENGAMRFFNRIGNHLFSIVWIPFTGMHKIDTLCGSKIFPKSLLDSCPNNIIANDPFGDFSILAAAFHNKTSVRSVPVNYLARTYGNTNIHRWRHGVQLLYIFLLFLFSLPGNGKKSKSIHS
jgi:glycosyltransferase involved in cell wall biosynthesis